MRHWIVPVLLVMFGVGFAFGATTATSSFDIRGVPGIKVTAAGATVTATGEDTNVRPTKRAFVYKLIDGASNEVNILLRVERGNGQLWIDMVSDANITSLSTRMASLDLTTVSPGHPSPTKDNVDTTALTSAGGS